MINYCVLSSTTAGLPNSTFYRFLFFQVKKGICKYTLAQLGGSKGRTPPLPLPPKGGGRSPPLISLINTLLKKAK